MSEQLKGTEAGANQPANDIRAPWERPTLRKLGAAEAEAGVAIHFDGGGFS